MYVFLLNHTQKKRKEKFLAVTCQKGPRAGKPLPLAAVSLSLFFFFGLFFFFFVVAQVDCSIIRRSLKERRKEGVQSPKDARNQFKTEGI